MYFNSIKLLLKNLIILSASVTLIIFILSFHMFNRTLNQSVEPIVKNVVNTLSVIRANLDLEKVYELMNDETLPETYKNNYVFKQINSYLYMQKKMYGFEYLFIDKEFKPGLEMLWIDSEPMNSYYFSPPGESYDCKIPRDVLAGFQENGYLYTEPTDYGPKWGKMIVIVIPLEYNHQIIGWLGVDVSVNAIYRMKILLFVIYGMVFLFLLVFNWMLGANMIKIVVSVCLRPTEDENHTSDS